MGKIRQQFGGRLGANVREISYEYREALDPLLSEFMRVTALIYGGLAAGTRPGHPDNERELYAYYND